MNFQGRLGGAGRGCQCIAESSASGKNALQEILYFCRHMNRYQENGLDPTGTAVLKRIPPRIEETVVVDNPSRVRHERIWGAEGALHGVVVARIAIQQPRPVLLLPVERGKQVGVVVAVEAVVVVGAIGAV